jgi:translation elongation factor EF-4
MADRARRPQGGHREMPGVGVACKRKPFDKQKEGKQRMCRFGKVDITQETFIAAPKVDV